MLGVNLLASIFARKPYSGVTEPEPDHLDPNYVFMIPNLTPDEKTGHIAAWSEEDFVKRLKTGRIHAGSKMPWEGFSTMTEEDLRSIYRYLKSLPPVHNDIGEIRRKI